MKKPILVWSDMEMTGLNLQKRNPDQIIEVAVLLTNSNLQPIQSRVLEANIKPGGVAGDFIVYEGTAAYTNALKEMNDKVAKMHSDNGLLSMVANRNLTWTLAELNTVLKQLIQEIKNDYPDSELWLCGNTISADQSFLVQYFPEVAHEFSSTLDVSTIKELVKLFFPAYPLYEKGDTHLGINDIAESLGELEYYQQHLAVKGPHSSIQPLAKDDRHNVPQHLVWLKIDVPTTEPFPIHVEYAITDKNLQIADKVITRVIHNDTELAALEKLLLASTANLPEGNYPLASKDPLTSRNLLAKYFPSFAKFFHHRNISLDTLINVYWLWNQSEILSESTLEEMITQAQTIIGDLLTEPVYKIEPLR